MGDEEYQGVEVMAPMEGQSWEGRFGSYRWG
jgi:hypothetical protein